MAYVVNDMRVAGHVLQETATGTLFNRVCTVWDLDVSTYVDGSTVIANILPQVLAVPGVPKLYSLCQDPALGYAKLMDRNIASIDGQCSTVTLNLLYKSMLNSANSGIPGSIWKFEHNFVTSQVKTSATAQYAEGSVVTNGGAPLFLFYKPSATTFPIIIGAVPPNAPGSGSTLPADPVDFVGYDALLRVSDEVITVTGSISGQDWETFLPQLRQVANAINSQPWGGFGRGLWYFPGFIAVTDDQGGSFIVQLPFFSRKLGWFSLGAYRNIFGDHPSDSAPESAIRSNPFPAVGTLNLMNGIGLASVQDEYDFSSFFGFTPNGFAFTDGVQVPLGFTP